MFDLWGSALVCFHLRMAKPCHFPYGEMVMQRSRLAGNADRSVMFPRQTPCSENPMDYQIITVI